MLEPINRIQCHWLGSNPWRQFSTAEGQVKPLRPILTNAYPLSTPLSVRAIRDFLFDTRLRIMSANYAELAVDDVTRSRRGSALRSRLDLRAQQMNQIPDRCSNHQGDEGKEADCNGANYCEHTEDGADQTQQRIARTLRFSVTTTSVRIRVATSITHPASF